MYGEIIILILTAVYLGLGLTRVWRGGYSTATVGFIDPVTVMGAGAAAGGASGLVSGYLNKRSAKQGRDAERRAMEEERRYNSLSADAALKEYEPWRGMEDKARLSMMDILGYNGPDAANAAIDALMKSPAVQQRLKTGQNTLENSAAAGGGLFSGRTGIALQKYGQDYAANEFDAEYGRRKGMMDWSYGNTGRRADIERGRYANEGAIVGRGERNMGQYQQAGTQAYGQVLPSLMSGAKTGMDMYGTAQKYRSIYDPTKEP